MNVPKEILDVKRPDKTIVEDSGKDGPNRYMVREHFSADERSEAGNPMAKNGRVVGHIYEGKFIEKVKTTVKKTTPEILQYGPAAFAKSVSSDIQDDILSTFDVDECAKIMSLATLFAIKPKLAYCRANTFYKKTFTSYYYPGTHLSATTICNFLQQLGMGETRRNNFFAKRLERVLKTEHILIDGMLKQDTSRVNDFSRFSYKAHVKGCKDLSVLYAFDLEKMEPICCEVFPGNHLDCCSFSKFIDNFNINKGIIVADKGFPISKIESQLSKSPDLGYISPIKRDDKRIATYKMLDFDERVPNTGFNILGKCKELDSGHYLYSFYDPYRAGGELVGFLNQQEKNSKHKKTDEKNVINTDEFKKRKESAGTVTMESNRKLTLSECYLAYDERWRVEDLFRRYKNINFFGDTNVQNEFSIFGLEFIYFIATLMTSRMLIKARDAGLLENMSYDDLLEDLSETWRRTSGPLPPKAHDSFWLVDRPEIMEEMQQLELLKDVKKIKTGKRGRPPKQTVIEKNA